MTKISYCDQCKHVGELINNCIYSCKAYPNGIPQEVVDRNAPDRYCENGYSYELDLDNIIIATAPKI